MRDHRAFIQRLHESGWSLALSVTGGGSEALSALLTVPGASNTVLDACVPYSNSALKDYLGQTPDQACSATTALQMAAVAYDRARDAARTTVAQSSSSGQSGQSAQSSHVCGVACTASLASIRPKRGPHRCHVATQSYDQTRLVTLQLSKGARDRAGEEALVAELILQQVGDTCGVAFPADLPLQPSEQPAVEHETAPALLAALCHEEREVLWSMPDGSWQTELCEPVVGLLCGSFNPLHDGHKQLRSVAESILRGPVHYEMTVHNADKPPLDYLTIAARRRQFQDIPLLLSNAGTFLQKARACPNTVFVIGFDTAVRILDPRFYSGNTDDVRDVLAQIRSSGCRFLVAGRADAVGFHTRDELTFPDDFADLFAGIAESEFRQDVSSTALRRGEA